MKIAIAGGSGFLGEPLVARLAASGHEVAVLTRNPSKVRAGRAVVWDGRTQGSWTSDVSASDVVINLAGENVGDGRWTDARKKQLVDSRVDTTRALITAIGVEPSRARTFINASAVGYFGLRGDEALAESAMRGSGFLADLTARWEEEARAAEQLARLVVLRFGVVLAGDGGALAKMLPPFKMGVGGRIGSGQQWMSWVSREDVLRMIEWAIANDSVRGVYNVTSPNPVRNVDFTRALARVLHRPALFTVPAAVLKMVFGEMAEQILLGGQRVVPTRALEERFVFSHPELGPALEHALKA